MSYRKIGLTTVAVTQDLLSGMPLVLKIELNLTATTAVESPSQPRSRQVNVQDRTFFSKCTFFVVVDMNRKFVM